MFRDAVVGVLFAVPTYYRKFSVRLRSYDLRSRQSVIGCLSVHIEPGSYLWSPHAVSQVVLRKYHQNNKKLTPDWQTTSSIHCWLNALFVCMWTFHLMSLWKTQNRNLSDQTTHFQSPSVHFRCFGPLQTCNVMCR